MSRGVASRFVGYSPQMEPTTKIIELKPGTTASGAAYDTVNNLFIAAFPTFNFIVIASLLYTPRGRLLKNANEEEISLQEYPRTHLVAIGQRSGCLVFGGLRSIDIVSRNDMKLRASVAREQFSYRHLTCIAVDEYHGRVLAGFGADGQITSHSITTGELMYASNKQDIVKIDSICVDNQGRVIAFCAAPYSCELVAYTPQLQPITRMTFVMDRAWVRSLVGFDALRGNIGLVHIERNKRSFTLIPANSWLPHTYEWTPDKHRYAPKEIQSVVTIVTNVRSLEPSLPLALLPNELLFLIFEHL